ncbi:beta-galactosidase trimerization domain-containing protein [Enterocloster clostridioformis]|nr:beta-galactosidase trimerization domain-containing protein [Enterocloster clostridioformis]MDB2134610.1 beta-galactosidase trimerization domain-containing protein [Enterocloster clostridioformis]
MQALGAQLAALSDAALGARTAAKAAIVVDWDNWWALEYSAGPSCELKYLDEVERYYQPFFELNIPVDIVSVEDDLEEYKIVVAKDQIISGVIHVIQNMYNPRLFVFVEV